MKIDYDAIVTKISNRIFPISLFFLIGDLIALILKILNMLPSIVLYILCAIIFIQLFMIRIYHVSNKKSKSIINLYNGLIDETLSFVIQFLYNPETHVNNSQVDEVDLCVEVVHIPEQLDDASKKNERYDLKFMWTLRGRNILETDLGQIDFRFGCNNAVEFSSLGFKAYHCQEETNRNCFNNVYTDCSESKHQNCKMDVMTVKMKSDNKKHITKMNEKYILSLEFNKAIKKDEGYIVKTSYVWPKCYNALLDYLVIDPKIHSRELGKFSLTVKADKKIITESSYTRLQYFPRTSTENFKLEGICNLRYNSEENAFESGLNNADTAKIYLLELRGVNDNKLG